MKILIIGQGQGGNAMLWMEYLNNRSDDGISYFYVCRNFCQKELKLSKSNDRLYKPYNVLGKSGIFSKIWAGFMARQGMQQFIKNLHKKQAFSAIHFHGNYSPNYALSIIKAAQNIPCVLSFYGSDYYQGLQTKKIDGSFLKVLNKAQFISFNFETMHTDFVNTFPQYKSKASVGCIGVTEEVLKSYKLNVSKDSIPMRFLSTRGLYSYNNVDALVSSFISVYGNNPNYRLDILNGYGWDDSIVKKVILMSEGVSNVYLRIGDWISDEELRDYYKKAHYNFCIGDTDQMTVSIMYGYVAQCINVLSPIRNYDELAKAGFISHQKLSSVSEQTLTTWFENVELPDNHEVAEHHAQKTIEYFSFAKRYENILKIFMSLR